MSEPILETRGLTLGYHGVPYVTGLNFTVEPGEIWAVLGANGAGKTTMILGLAGVLRPQEGSVYLSGRLAPDRLSHRANIGLSLITQERCVFMGLSVIDNLRVGKCDPEVAFDYFPELRPHARRTVGLLSGGQQQILAVARALARSPKVLLADELSTGLAPTVVERIFRALSDATAKGDMSVVVVEQHINKILRIADRGLVLRRGRVVLSDDADSLRRRIGEIEAHYL